MPPFCMDKSIKKLISAGAGFLFLVCGLLGYLLLGDVPDHVQSPNIAMESCQELPKQKPGPAPELFGAGALETKTISPNASKAVSPSAFFSVTTEANDPVSEILSRPDEDFANTVNQLLTALPKLNPEQQAEAAQHIANLSDDALAAQWSQKMIVQSLPQPASELLFNDLLNRPHELLMPFLSKLADMPQHSQSTQSVEILEVLYGQPPAGTKWEKWVKIKAQEAP